jgi:hypothetical protein
VYELVILINLSYTINTLLLLLRLINFEKFKSFLMWLTLMLAWHLFVNHDSPFHYSPNHYLSMQLNYLSFTLTTSEKSEAMLPSIISSHAQNNNK